MRMITYTVWFSHLTTCKSWGVGARLGGCVITPVVLRNTLQLALSAGVLIILKPYTLVIGKIAPFCSVQ